MVRDKRRLFSLSHIITTVTRRMAVGVITIIRVATVTVISTAATATSITIRTTVRVGNRIIRLG